MWILAMAAIVGMTSAAWAAEPESGDESTASRYEKFLADKTSTRSAARRAVRRYSRDRATAIKNYRKLFEADDEKAAPATAETPSAEKPAEVAGDVRHANHQRDEAASRDAQVHQVAGEGETAPTAPIYRAQYRSRPELREKIQRIRAEKSTPELPSVDLTTETAVAEKAESIIPSAGSAATGTPVVNLQWKMHGEVNVGRECECSLIVTNPSPNPAHEVIVEAAFPTSVRLLDAQPEPADSIERLVWKFPELEAGANVDIRIRMIPSIPGELATSASVRFTGTATADFTVEEPLLVVNMKGPETAVVGDNATHMVTVSNPGTGVAHNVVLQATIPEGLKHAKGKELSIGVGSLGPGESRSIRLALSAVTGGEHIVLVQAEGDAGLKQRAAARIDVIAPSLAVKIEGPSLRYINRHGKYTLTVTNDGGAASNNVRVYHELPEGFEFVKASNGGKADSAGRGVTWYVGHLDAGQSVDLNIDLIAKTIGDFKHHVRVTSDEGSQKEIELAATVEGSAALVLDINDQDDPVEVGLETWIEAKVQNRGTKAAANMGISIELPTGVELIAAEGPSGHFAENGLLVFKSIDELAPNESVTYRLRVVGHEAGNLRFRARLTSDSIQQPLIVEELTKFYGE